MWKRSGKSFLPAPSKTTALPHWRQPLCCRLRHSFGARPKFSLKLHQIDEVARHRYLKLHQIDELNALSVPQTPPD